MAEDVLRKENTWTVWSRYGGMGVYDYNDRICMQMAPGMAAAAESLIISSSLPTLSQNALKITREKVCMQCDVTLHVCKHHQRCLNLTSASISISTPTLLSANSNIKFIPSNHGTSHT
jgi:hypothetical protein